jgi:hypothetical protein
MAMTAALDLSPDDFDVISPSVYARHGYPHDEWRRARHESPVHHYPDSPIAYRAITERTVSARIWSVVSSACRFATNCGLLEGDSA